MVIVCPPRLSSRCSLRPSCPHISSALRASCAQNAFSPALCQSVSNLQLLRLFSSLLPLGSVSGTVSPFTSLHSCFPPFLCIQHIPSSILFCLICHPCLSVCPPSVLTHFAHEVKFRVFFTQINLPLTQSVDLGPVTSLKPRPFPGVAGSVGCEVLLVHGLFSLFPVWCCWSFSI